MDTFYDEISNIERVFKGIQHGIVLAKRGTNDNHIKIFFIVEDDGNWFLDRGNGFSSHWFLPFNRLITEVDDWLVYNTDPDPSGFGRVFRT